MNNIINIITNIITNIWNNLGSIINNLILGVLAFDTVRNVLRHTGWFPRNNPIFGFLYSDYDIELVKRVFTDLGYSENEADNSIKKLKSLGKNRQGMIVNDKRIIDKLLFDVAQCISHYDKKIGFGENVSNKSNYYINTMEAIHNASLKYELADYLERKILNTEQVESIDFVLVPKGGNPLLGLQVAEDFGCEIILAKDGNDSAQVRKPKTSGVNEQKDDLLKRRRTRFEGYQRLLNKRTKQGRKLYGIAIDDNAAGGSLLESMVMDFNLLVESDECEIEKVTNCYVLFKLVKYNKQGKEVDIDKMWADKGIRLNRYFDLSEENRKLLLESLHQENGDEYDFYTEEIQGKIKEIRPKLYKVFELS